MNRNSVYLTILGMLLLALSTCSDPGAWYPKGSPKILTFHEQDDMGFRYCIVNYRLKNIGTTEILTSTVSIRLETDKNTYYQTIVDERNLLPGGSVTGSVEIEYYTQDEKTKRKKIKIIDSFFR